MQDSAAATMDNVKNSQTVQSIANGPVADKARAEADNTKSEFSNLAASRQTPQTQTANGQALTHYHSFFYNLLSWENPRATSIMYATIVSLIFTMRYMPVARYILRIVYLLLGLTSAAELVGKFAVGDGFASKMRPKRYYTIPRETLESILADVEELTNFFVIEFQRIVFAENVYMTIGAFSTAFITYWLVKFMPTWGLALFFTTVIFFTPLAYIQNKELIDQQILNAQDMVNEQTGQLRDIAAQHTNTALEMSQATYQEYSSKVQEMLGQGKQAAVEKNVVSPETADKIVPGKPVNGHDFPAAPKTELPKSEPYISSPLSQESKPELVTV